MKPYLLLFIELIGVIAVVLLLSISPALKARRPVQFTQPRREGLLALYVAVLILFFTGIAAFLTPLSIQKLIPFIPFNVVEGVVSKPTGLTLSDMLLNVGFVAVILLPVLWTLRYRKQPWLSVGLKKVMVQGGMQLGFALALIVIFLRGKVFTLIQGSYDISTLYQVISILAFVFVQELVFRGFIQLRFENWLGEKNGWMITSVVNALWISIPLFAQSWQVWLPTFGYQLAISLLAGWILKRSGGILAGSIYRFAHLFLMWL